MYEGKIHVYPLNLGPRTRTRTVQVGHEWHMSGSNLQIKLTF